MVVEEDELEVAAIDPLNVPAALIPLLLKHAGVDGPAEFSKMGSWCTKCRRKIKPGIDDKNACHCSQY